MVNNIPSIFITVDASMCFELTLFYNHYKDYFELDSVYLVDPLALKMHDKDVDFEPQKAILQIIDEYKDAPNTSSNERFPSCSSGINNIKKYIIKYIK